MDLESLPRKAKRAVGSAGMSTTGTIAKHFLSWVGVPIAAGMIVLMDMWNYMFKKEDIKQEYQKEIAATLSKRPEDVTQKDLNAVAHQNPTIGEAIGRIKRKRNLDIVSNIACTVGIFAMVGAIAGPIGVAIGTGIGAIALTSTIGFLGFLAGKYILDKVGEKVLGLSEPSIKKVQGNPALQEKLSLPSQVAYLEQQQNNRKNISAAQIVTLFNKAQSPIALGDAAMIADKLNDGVMDATELAFTVHGQASGVPERESRQLSYQERINAELQERLSVTQDKLKEVSEAAKDKAGDIVGSIKDKSTYWREKFANRHSSQITPEAIQSQREQQASGVGTPS